MNEPDKHAAEGGAAAVIVATIAVAASIYLLKGIIAPFLMAVFLLIVIGGLSRLIRKLASGMPRGASMIVALAIILALFAVIVWVSYDNIALLLQDADQYTQRLTAIGASLQRAFGVAIPSGVERLMRGIDVPGLVGLAAEWLRTAVSSTGFVLIYLGFMMASRRSFSRKLLALTGARAGLAEAEALFERIREAVAGYIWVQTATGLLIGVLSWIALLACGVPQPVFWAFLIFIASYIPIVGGIVGVLVPVLFSIAVSGDFTKTIILFVALQGIQIAVGNIVQPRMQSRNLNVDPIVVLLSLALWGVLLGPVGAFLSTPLTVTAMALLAQFERTRWMAILLSDDGRPIGPAPPDPPPAD